MKHRPVTLLNVVLNGREPRKVGRLAAQNRRILFEYDAAFLATGIDLSPFQLPRRSGVLVCDPQPFDGLFGVFNDSLPDGWGRLLVDRAVEQLGMARQDLTPLDRLAHAGAHGMGALTYEPDLSKGSRPPVILKLNRLADEAAAVLAGAQGAVVEELLRLNGASAGARPKIVAQVSADKRQIIHSPKPLPTGYSHWMIKFPSAQDDATVGAIEYAYSLMARAAGIVLPGTYLFGTGNRRYFGIERFDRDGDRRIHMHSLSGLLHADHRAPSLDYDGLLTATLVLTKNAMEMERAFRLAAFNVLAHNRDDHAKNVSYLLDEATGQWTLAPAYDLTFSSGPGGEQSMLVMGEGRAPGIEHLRALSKKHDLKRGEAILDQVRAAIANWTEFADAARLTKKAAKLIADRIVPKPETASKPKPLEKKPAKKLEAKSRRYRQKPR